MTDDETEAAIEWVKRMHVAECACRCEARIVRHARVAVIYFPACPWFERRSFIVGDYVDAHSHSIMFGGGVVVSASMPTRMALGGDAPSRE